MTDAEQALPGEKADAPFRPVPYSVGAFICSVQIGGQMMAPIMLVLTGPEHPLERTLLRPMLVATIILASIAGLFVWPRITPKVILAAWPLLLLIGLGFAVVTGKGEAVPAVVFLLLTVAFFTLLATPIFLPSFLLSVWIANRLRVGHIGLFGVLGVVFGGATYLLLNLAFVGRTGGLLTEGPGQHPLATLLFCGAGLIACMSYRWLQLRFPGEAPA